MVKGQPRGELTHELTGSQVSGIGVMREGWLCSGDVTGLDASTSESEDGMSALRIDCQERRELCDVLLLSKKCQVKILR